MHILILTTRHSGDDSQQRDNANQTRERVILLIEFAQAKIPPHVASPWTKPEKNLGDAEQKCYNDLALL
jgi:hypothetical protein